MGVCGMVEMVAVVFIVLVFGLVMAYLLGDRFMKKSVFIVIGVTAIVIGLLALGFGFGALAACIVMLLWNSCLLGTIAGVSAIGFWQAWGIMILSGFLFKGGIAAVVESYFKNKKK
jgi:hypothetical protein